MAEAAGTNLPDVGEALDPESEPHLEVFDRMCSISADHSAIKKTGSTYTCVKRSNDIFTWALSHFEPGMHYASSSGASTAMPMARKFERPLNAVDQTLCKGRDFVEPNASSVKEQPEHIITAARTVLNSPMLNPVMDKVNAAKNSPAERDSLLQEASLAKANHILDTQFGREETRDVRNTTIAVRRLLDRYFPYVVSEEAEVIPDATDEDIDIYAAILKISELPATTASRIYHSIAVQIYTISPENVTIYASNVMTILYLIRLLEVTNRKAQAAVEKMDEEKEVEEMN